MTEPAVDSTETITTPPYVPSSDFIDKASDETIRSFLHKFGMTPEPERVRMLHTCLTLLNHPDDQLLLAKHLDSLLSAAWSDRAASIPIEKRCLGVSRNNTLAKQSIIKKKKKPSALNADGTTKVVDGNKVKKAKKIKQMVDEEGNVITPMVIE